VTPVQKNALDFIRAQVMSTGVCPSYVEISRQLGVKSKSASYRVVDALIREGYLVRGTAGAARSLRLVESNLRDVPTVALVAELERRGVILG